MRRVLIAALMMCFVASPAWAGQISLSYICVSGVLKGIPGQKFNLNVVNRDVGDVLGVVGAIIRATEPSPLSPPGGVIAQSTGLAFEANPYSLDTTQLNTNTRAYARAVFTVVRNACTAGPLDLFGRLVCFLESLEPEGVATFEVSSINAAIQGTDDSLPMDCRLNTSTPIP